MIRKTYEQTDDYKKAAEIVANFVDEVLDGDIDAMRTFCFDNLTKFVGRICDPDMYLIVQAIYIIVWGDIYDLTFDNMGEWDWKGTHAYRGDTMNSFGSVIGKENKDREFGYRAKFFGADKNLVIWSKIEEFWKIYHWLGNFIVIPNRGSVKYGINGARACYYDTDYCEGMRDYFDWFLMAISDYQDKVKGGDIHLSKFEMQLQRNPEYNPSFLDISEWEDRFFLKPYFENRKPKLFFQTPLNRRLLITAAPENRENKMYYEEEEYLNLIEDYIDKSKEVIIYRTNKMVDFLKEKVCCN